MVFMYENTVEGWQSYEGGQPSLMLPRLYSICRSQWGVSVEVSRKEFFILKTYGARNTLVCGEEKENRVCAEMVYLGRFTKICLKAHLKLVSCQPWDVINVGWVLFSTL